MQEFLAFFLLCENLHFCLIMFIILYEKFDSAFQERKCFMKQKLKELIYLREEEMMNIGCSMNKTYLIRKYLKRFYKYCSDENIEYYDVEIAKKFLKDEYQCLIY